MRLMLSSFPFLDGSCLQTRPSGERGTGPPFQDAYRETLAKPWSLGIPRSELSVYPQLGFRQLLSPKHLTKKSSQAGLCIRPLSHLDKQEKALQSAGCRSVAPPTWDPAPLLAKCFRSQL